MTTTRATDGAKVLLDANGQPTDWEVVKTAGKCRRKTYYWNGQTGAVSWEVPAEAAPTTNRRARKRDRASVELTPQGMQDTNDIRLATA